jgi:transcriptional regulator with XRE-family HTH domain
MGTFRDKVKARREAMGLSQAALAAAIDEDRHHYNNFERGRRNFRPDVLIQMAQALDLPPQQVIAWKALDDLGVEAITLAYEAIQATKQAPSGTTNP